MKKLEREEMVGIEGGGFDQVGIIFEADGIVATPIVPHLSADDETVGTLP